MTTEAPQPPSTSPHSSPSSAPSGGAGRNLSATMRSLLLACLEFEASDRCVPGHLLDMRVVPLASRRGLIAWGNGLINPECCLTPKGRKLALDLAAEAGR